METMMSIGEFARSAGLSVSAVRFYGDRGLLVPAAIDERTGYRCYDPTQLERAGLLRELRLIEMPLAEVADALDMSYADRQVVVRNHLQRLEDALHRAHTIANKLGAMPLRTETSMETMMQAADFARALDQVLPACADDARQPHLMSVLIEGKAGSIRLVATDSHRLAVRDLVAQGESADFSALMPAVTLLEWRDLLPGDGTVSLEVGDRTLRCVAGDMNEQSRLVPAQFPDYEAVLESSPDRSSAEVERSALLDVLAGAGPEAVVSLQTDADALVITAGDRAHTIPARRSGESRSVQLNTSFCIDAVRAAVGAEVVVELGQPRDTVIIRSADDGTFTSMIMPIVD